MNLNDLKQEWSKDSYIDPDNLFTDSLRCGVLHSKYLNIRTGYSLESKDLEILYSKEFAFKLNYYSGKFNHPEYEEMLKSKGLEFQKIKYMKSDIQKILDADDVLAEILKRKSVAETIVAYCDEVIKQIHSRQFAIKNAIDWRKFEAGF